MINQGPNLVRRIIDVAAANAAPTMIYATGPTRAWRIIESIVTSAGVAVPAAQGFTVKIPNDNSANGFAVKFARPAAVVASEPGEFPAFENWNRCSQHGAYGEPFAGPGSTLGAGGGTSTATLLAEVGSLTNTVTSIEIVEYF